MEKSHLEPNLFPRKLQEATILPIPSGPMKSGVSVSSRRTSICGQLAQMMVLSESGLCLRKQLLDMQALTFVNLSLIIKSLASNEEALPLTKDGDLDESAKGRCVDICPEDKTIVVGCKNGTIRVTHFPIILPLGSLC